jgi:hypothetical protein
VAAALEAILRTLSNLVEELHHARPQYLVLSPLTIVEDVWCARHRAAVAGAPRCSAWPLRGRPVAR